MKIVWNPFVYYKEQGVECMVVGVVMQKGILKTHHMTCLKGKVIEDERKED